MTTIRCPKCERGYIRHRLHYKNAAGICVKCRLHVRDGLRILERAVDASLIVMPKLRANGVCILCEKAVHTDDCPVFNMLLALGKYKTELMGKP